VPDLDVEVVTGLDELRERSGSWAQLHARAGCSNPFAHPGWLVPWAERFARADDLRCLLVADRGELVGVAPLYVDRTLPAASVLRVLGTGGSSALVELPEVLSHGDHARRVLRAVVGWSWANTHAWAWAELPVAAGQGWLEPGWLPDTGAGAGNVVHKGVRACVVCALPSEPDALERGMKRNLREALRRARNRLGRTGEPWSIEVHEGDAVAGGLDDLVELHEARATLPGKVHHPGRFGDAAARAFLREAVTAVGQGPGAEILVLRVGDRPAAARLVLHANEAIYLGWSGVSAEHYDISGVTLLTAEAMRRAIARGDRKANLSTGPDTAKLRWSETLEVHHEFLVCAPRRAARAVFGAYRAASALAATRRERAYREVLG
jgi:CelD/BcsL family acetyltransferase involved in cellulose biosynthesis